MELILIIVGVIAIGVLLLVLGEYTAEKIKPALPSFVSNFVKSVITGFATFILTGKIMGLDQAGYFGLIVGILVFIIKIWKNYDIE